MPARLLGLLGLSLNLCFDIHIANGLDLALVDLAILVDSRVVDSVDPSLVQQDDEDDVVSEARQPGVSVSKYQST
jgi:hypothetical protein